MERRAKPEATYVGRPLGAAASWRSRGGFLELLLHRLGEGVDPAHRADVDSHVVDAALVVEVQEVDPFKLALADPRAEHERRRAIGLGLAGVAEVLEHLADRTEQHGHRVAAL